MNCLLISWQIPRVGNFWRTSNNVVNVTSRWQLWIYCWRQNTDCPDHLLIHKPLRKLWRGWTDRQTNRYCTSVFCCQRWIGFGGAVAAGKFCAAQYGTLFQSGGKTSRTWTRGWIRGHSGAGASARSFPSQAPSYEYFILWYRLCQVTWRLVYVVESALESLS